jgi:hypothetical protein
MAEVAGGVLAVHPPIRQHSNAHLFDSTFPAVRDSGKPSRRRRISRTAHFQPQFLATDSVSYMAALETAAKQEGRSLSEEIEFRLEQSLDEERHMADALELGFGRQVAGLMLAIGHVMKEAEPARRPGELGWLSNPEAFRQIVESINLLLEAIDPDAHPAVWARLRRAYNDEDDSTVVELNAALVAVSLADPLEAEAIDLGPLIPTTRSWLGEAVIARLKDRLAFPRPPEE